MQEQRESIAGAHLMIFYSVVMHLTWCENAATMMWFLSRLQERNQQIEQIRAVSKPMVCVSAVGLMSAFVQMQDHNTMPMSKVLPSNVIVCRVCAAVAHFVCASQNAHSVNVAALRFTHTNTDLTRKRMCVVHTVYCWRIVGRQDVNELWYDIQTNFSSFALLLTFTYSLYCRRCGVFWLTDILYNKI